MFEQRITVHPDVMGGRPCIRGLRFPVSRLLSLLAAGQSEREILANHPDLEATDIRAAIEYAAAGMLLLLRRVLSELDPSVLQRSVVVVDEWTIRVASLPIRPPGQ